MKITRKTSLLFFLLISAILITTYFVIYFSQETKTLNDETRKEAVNGTFIKLSSGVTHYELVGSDTAETIIFVHGGGSGYFCFDNNFDSLAKAGYRVVRFDLYGRGYSDRVNEDYTLELFNSQLTELLDSLKIKNPVNLLGMSMGAMIVIKYADMHPEKVKSLILVDPAALNATVPPLPLRIPVLSDILMTTYWYPKAVKKQMSEYYKPENVPEYASKLSKQMQYYGFKKAILSTWKNTLSKNMAVEIDRIGKHKRPVLLVWGDHDPWVPVPVSEKYLSAMPEAKLIVIKDAGHVSCYERPDLVNPALLRFLKAQ